MLLIYAAKTLVQFIKHLGEIRAAWMTKKEGEPDLWYRGMQKSQWSLVPKIYRSRGSLKELLEAEDEIREEFVRRAPSLTSYKPSNAWEWYFLMQHYGAPTRLLDWTEDPLLALYFALKDTEGLHDAVVWALDPWRLNERAIGKFEVLPPGSDGLSESDIRKYKPWLPNRFDAKHQLKKTVPVAIYPNQFDRRMAAQRSGFTIHGASKQSLDELFRGSKRLLAKIVIPGRATEEVLDALEAHGIDEATVYPDLEGLGKSVARWLPRETRPVHEGVYTRLKPSPINGVGVFAIKNIKKGTPLFSEDSDEMHWVRAEELPKEKAIMEFYKDFAVVRKGRDGRAAWYGCPRNFHRLTMSWYLNDPEPGEKPNVRCDDDYEFFANQNIKAGDELTVNSHAYSGHPALKPKDSKAKKK